MDLLNLPDTLTESLLCLLHQVECGSPWPQQMVVGIVKALAKHPMAQMVQEFRPITVFSLTYRTWGSIRSRQALRFLKKLAPHSLLGNKPGASPKHLWFHVQELVEASRADQSHVAGGVLDIVKCFNGIPRYPVLSIAEHVGLPAKVVTPWRNALSQMHRRFEVKGSYGGPILSTCGLPEGDGLSVVGMQLINFAIEAWVYHQYPKATTWSYVDNIETIADTAEEALGTMQSLRDVCELLDLQIVSNKTFCWANYQEGRSLIKQQGMPTKLAARDLGGHMNYSRRYTNFTIQQKIGMLAPFWNRLARSQFSTAIKVRAVTTMAWPNLFYGIAISQLGSTHFTKLRTMVMRGLGITQKGANPLLHLSCILRPKTDPECYCVCQTIVTYCDFHTAEHGEFVLQHLIHGGKPTQGPSNSFLTSLHKLAWTWIGHGECTDQFGTQFNLFACSRRELLKRIHQAWQHRVLAETADQRVTMKDLHKADVFATQQSLQTFPPEQQSLLRCALNGTQYTNDVLMHMGKVDTVNCRFCGNPDGPIHRHWHCHFFADIRDKFPSVTQKVDELPHSCLAHAWVPRIAAKATFEASLAAVPDTTATLHFPPDSSIPYPTHDYFLDGGCIMPNQPLLRVATWAMVIWTEVGFWTLGSGGVPGLQQTALRGEITAAIAVMKAVVYNQQRARLWFDNQDVHDTLNDWLRGGTYEHATRTDADLWLYLWMQFQQAKHLVQRVNKVKAHCEADAQVDEVEQWAVAGNTAADRATTAARQHLPSSLWQAWTRLKTELAQQRLWARDLHAMFAEIGQRAVQSTQNAQEARPQGLPMMLDAPMTCDEGLVRLAQCNFADLPRKCQTDEARHILSWLQQMVRADTMICWISFHQLLLLYQQFSGSLGPRPQTKKCGVTWCANEDREGYNHPQQVLWLSQFLLSACKSLGRPIQVQQRRAPSHVLCFWSGCIRGVTTNAALQSLDTHLQQQVASLPVRQVRLLGEVTPMPRR